VHGFGVASDVPLVAVRELGRGRNLEVLAWIFDFGGEVSGAEQIASATGLRETIARLRSISLSAVTIDPWI
jgi:hypothetical protein